MTEDLLEIIRSDIKRCEVAQGSEKGTYDLYQALVAKYNSIFENFKEDIPVIGKACVVGVEYNYKSELKQLRKNWKYLLQQIKKMTHYLISKLCTKRIWSL